MSYCRMNGEDSDIYLYNDITNGRICMSCPMIGDGEGHVLMPNAKDAIAHCKKHRELGHKVPAYAFTRLREEAKEEAIKQKKWMKEFFAMVKKNDKKKKDRMRREKPKIDKIMKQLEKSSTNKQG